MIAFRVAAVSRAPIGAPAETDWFERWGDTLAAMAARRRGWRESGLPTVSAAVRRDRAEGRGPRG